MALNWALWSTLHHRFNLSESNLVVTLSSYVYICIGRGGWRIFERRSRWLKLFKSIQIVCKICPKDIDLVQCRLFQTLEQFHKATKNTSLQSTEKFSKGKKLFRRPCKNLHVKTWTPTAKTFSDGLFLGYISWKLQGWKDCTLPNTSSLYFPC